MKKAYIDIDGVLLTKNGEPQNCVEQFLEYVTANYDCYWATTHVVDGTIDHALRYLRSKNFSEKQIKLAQKIKGTSWEFLKTEAMDLESDFIWFEDQPTSSDFDKLKFAGKSQSLELISEAHTICHWLSGINLVDGEDIYPNNKSQHIEFTQPGLIWSAGFILLALLMLYYLDNKNAAAFFLAWSLYFLYRTYKGRD